RTEGEHLHRRELETPPLHLGRPKCSRPVCRFRRLRIIRLVGKRLPHQRRLCGPNPCYEDESNELGTLSAPCSDRRPSVPCHQPNSRSVRQNAAYTLTASVFRGSFHRITIW